MAALADYAVLFEANQIAQKSESMADTNQDAALTALLQDEAIKSLNLDLAMIGSTDKIHVRKMLE